MCCKASRVEPSSVITLQVTDDDPNPRELLDPTCTKRLAFVLATTTDPRGLEAFGIDFLREGAPDDATSYWSPQRSTSSRQIPPASLTIPPGLHRAEEYPSPWRGLLLAKDQRNEVQIRNLTGEAPYSVSLYFFAEEDMPE